MLFGLIAAMAVIGSLLWFGLAPEGAVSVPVPSDTKSVIDQAYEAREKLQQHAVSATGGTSEQVTSTGQSQNTFSSFRTLYPLTIGGVVVQASLATTTTDRTQGLSGTVTLPEGVVKLFVFEELGRHGIWMKDMFYSIDIIWVDEQGKVVYYETHVSPDTYPKIFTPPVPAKYVIETNAGFVAREGLQIGNQVTVPPQAIADK